MMSIWFISLFVCVVVLAIMFIWLLSRSIITKHVMFVITTIICFGLFFDSFVILIGNYMSDDSDILKTLSTFRFVLHGALVPLNIMICAYALNKKNNTIKIWWAISILIMIIGIMAGFATVLVIDKSAGIVRYASSDATPIWASLTIILLSFATTVPVIVCGIIQIVKKRNFYLFFAGFFMLIFSMIAPATGHNELNFLISIFGEILMVCFYCLYANEKYKNMN